MGGKAVAEEGNNVSFGQTALLAGGGGDGDHAERERVEVGVAAEQLRVQVLWRAGNVALPDALAIELSSNEHDRPAPLRHVEPACPASDVLVLSDGVGRGCGGPGRVLQLNDDDRLGGQVDALGQGGGGDQDANLATRRPEMVLQQPLLVSIQVRDMEGDTTSQAASELFAGNARVAGGEIPEHRRSGRQSKGVGEVARAPTRGAAGASEDDDLLFLVHEPPDERDDQLTAWLYPWLARDQLLALLPTVRREMAVCPVRAKDSLGEGNWPLSTAQQVRRKPTVEAAEIA